MTDADDCRKRTALKERRERQAEKSRLEAMAAKMSAKKLQRLRKVCQIPPSSPSIPTPPSRPGLPQIAGDSVWGDAVRTQSDPAFSARAGRRRSTGERRTLVHSSRSVCAEPHCCIPCIAIPGSTSPELRAPPPLVHLIRIDSVHTQHRRHRIRLRATARSLSHVAYRPCRKFESRCRETSSLPPARPISANFPWDVQRLSYYGRPAGHGCG
jgi:hypothetical protein